MGYRFRWISFAAALALTACGGGSNSGSSVGTSPPPPQNTPDSGCSGFCANRQFVPQRRRCEDDHRAGGDRSHSAEQAVRHHRHRSRRQRARRVSHGGAPPTIQIRDPRTVVGGLEGLNVPPELGAISKAITAVYFSSEGNAFTSRTAGQVAQEHFNTGQRDRAGRTAVRRADLQSALLRHQPALHRRHRPGTHSAPLGLSPDPGGISLYKPACRSARSAFPARNLSTRSTTTPRTRNRHGRDDRRGRKFRFRRAGGSPRRPDHGRRTRPAIYQ